MGLLEILQTVYPKIFIVSVPILLTALLPHLLPTTASGITPHLKLSAATISLTFWTIARAGTAILDQSLIRKGIAVQAPDYRDGLALPCGIDAIVVAALITGMAAHLPVVALHRYQTLPSPKRPIPSSLNTLRTTITLILVYTYALLPCIPTLAGAVASDAFNGSSIAGNELTADRGVGFAKWWGFYCVERGDWFRIGKNLYYPAPLGITALSQKPKAFCTPNILLPVVVTLPLTILIFSALYSTSGHPSSHIHPTRRNWAQAAFLLVLALAVIGYVVLEQVIGWSADWWPRSLEALAAPLLLICLVSDSRIWIAYIYWMRLKRPPAPLLPPSSPIPSPLLSSPKSPYRSEPDFDPETSPTPSRTSSFLIPPPTALKRGVHFPPTPQRNTIIPYSYHPSMLSNLSNTTSAMTDRMEELLPPLRRSEEHRAQDTLDLERGLHPHPHSIDGDHSLPTDLCTQVDPHSSMLYAQADRHNDLPRPSSSTSTPTSQRGSDNERRYTSSTSSSPFAYEAFATMYSSNGPLSSSSNSMISAPFPYATSTVYTDRTPLPTSLPVADPNGSRDTYDSMRSTGIGPMRADRRSVVPTVRVIDEPLAKDANPDQPQRLRSRARLPVRSSTMNPLNMSMNSGSGHSSNQGRNNADEFPRPKVRSSTVDGLLSQLPDHGTLRGHSVRGRERPLTEVSSVYSQPSLLEAYGDRNPDIASSRSSSRQSLPRGPSSTFSISNYSYPHPSKHLVRSNTIRSSISSSSDRSHQQPQLQPQRPSLLGHTRTDSTLSGPSLYDDSNHPLESLAEHDGEAEEEAGRIVFESNETADGGYHYDYMEEIEGDYSQSTAPSNAIQATKGRTWMIPGQAVLSTGQ
ncbi:hypothetical protein I316_02665 [Kwoniella heveanensis BCC8398]|uniref:Uncharacterized protein n=1 Tax=Kwoniella heveanensis BCC8398 TaxID=1296120 RepID=A0A1B9GX66_9TREE|nr:hypothetical protein I316_02665 [Kwoniella heveanensis BCC8398]